MGQTPITVTAKIRAFLNYWLPPLLLTCVIVAFASDLGSAQNFRLSIYLLKLLFPWLPAAEIYRWSLVIRKIGHFIVYGLLCLSYVRAFYRQLHLSRRLALLAALLICLVVASADEGRQFFYASRSGRVEDVLLDMSGAATAGLVWLSIAWLRTVRESQT